MAGVKQNVKPAGISTVNIDIILNWTEKWPKIRVYSNFKEIKEIGRSEISSMGKRNVDKPKDVGMI